jgi:hypothetical protein
MTIKHEYKAIFSEDTYDMLHGVGPGQRLFRTVKVLEAMLWGLEVELGEGDGLGRFRLAESADGGLVLTMIRGEGDGEHFLGLGEFSLLGLSRLAAKMSDAYFERLCVGLAASKALTAINQKSRPNLSRDDHPDHEGRDHE